MSLITKQISKKLIIFLMPVLAGVFVLLLLAPGLLNSDSESNLAIFRKPHIHLFSVSQSLEETIAPQARNAFAQKEITVKTHSDADDLSQIPENSFLVSDNFSSFPEATYKSIESEPIRLNNCDSFLFVGVHFTNTLTSVSLEQLKQILSGEITNWSQLGTNLGTITILVPDTTDDHIAQTYTTILDHLIPDDSSAKIEKYLATPEAIQTVLDHPDYMALLPANAFESSPELRHLSVDEISPLKEQGDTTIYPLQYSLLVQTNSTDQDKKNLLLDSLRSSGFEETQCFPDIVSLKATGDIMLSRHVGTKIREAEDHVLPFRKTADYLADADITFANLESPFYDQGSIVTEGMVFKAEPETIAGLEFAGIDLVDLANNHFGNQGRAGMTYTFEHLNENDISYFGAGSNYDEAHHVRIMETQGYKIGFLGYDEVPPVSYQADSETPGFSLEEKNAVQIDIRAALAQTDFLIVSFHWGIEYTPDPSLVQKQFAHLAIDSGADMVISHHPHVVQAVEFYQGKFIAYSLGNFVFDQMWSTETQQGLIANISLAPIAAAGEDAPQRPLQPISIDLVAVRIHDYNQPNFADQSETNQILKRVFNASKNL